MFVIPMNSKYVIGNGNWDSKSEVFSIHILSLDAYICIHNSAIVVAVITYLPSQHLIQALEQQTLSTWEQLLMLHFGEIVDSDFTEELWSQHV